MTHSVGLKGQVVIAKEILERLGVQPGWRTIQRLVDDHVEIFFIPPEHSRSLKGSLAPYVDTSIDVGEAWRKAREDAWEAAADDDRLTVRGEAVPRKGSRP